MEGFTSVQTDLYEDVPTEPVAEQPAETLQDIVADDNSPQLAVAENSKTEEIVISPQQQEQIETMETVMNQGMEFLAGMFKMATGKDMGLESKKMEIDKETGEIVMRFKMPGLMGR